MISNEYKTVKQVIEELQQYPKDALCSAYEGGIVGLIIYEDSIIDGKFNRKHLGKIHTSSI